MPNHWFAILTLTLICSLPLEFNEQAQAKVGTATVSGRVTIKGEPARRVTVFLKAQEGSGTSELYGKTNENGIFRITGVPAGRYTPNTITQGYIITRRSGDGWTIGARVINVAEGEIVENVEIELVPGSVITGRVTGSNDRPLVEEQVELWWVNKDGTVTQFTTPEIRKMLTTDDRGIYRLFGQLPGRYLLSAGGYSKGTNGYLQKTYHPNVTDKSQAKVVEVGEGEEATGVDLNVVEVDKTYSIFGRVGECRGRSTG
jgi:hypothetical protein